MGEMVLRGGMPPPLGGVGAGWMGGEPVPESIPGAKGAGALTVGPAGLGTADGTGSGAGLVAAGGVAGETVGGTIGGIRPGVVAIGLGTIVSDWETPGIPGVGAGRVAPGGTTDAGGVEGCDRPGATGAGRIVGLVESGISPIGV